MVSATLGSTPCSTSAAWMSCALMNPSAPFPISETANIQKKNR